MKRVRVRKGDIVQINLDDGSMAFGRVLHEPLMAFYDIKSSSLPTLNNIATSKVLFKVWVMKSAITSARWKVIGNLPLENDLEKSPVFFRQDAITKKYYLYQDGLEKPASKAECEGLERAAVWDPVHIEDRLSDYFAKKPNKWVESLSAK